ncbi:DUF6325 family protein [Microbacterium sp. AGC85]
MPALGDLEVLVVQVSADRPSPAVLEALLHEVESGALRLIDFLLVHRRSRHGFDVTEVDDADFTLAGLSLHVPGLVGSEDARRIAAELPLYAWAAVILIEPIGGRGRSDRLVRMGHPITARFHVPSSRANSVWARARRVR